MVLSHPVCGNLLQQQQEDPATSNGLRIIIAVVLQKLIHSLFLSLSAPPHFPHPHFSPSLPESLENSLHATLPYFICLPHPTLISFLQQSYLYSIRNQQNLPWILSIFPLYHSLKKSQKKQRSNIPQKEEGKKFCQCISTYISTSLVTNFLKNLT